MTSPSQMSPSPAHLKSLKLMFKLPFRTVPSQNEKIVPLVEASTSSSQPRPAEYGQHGKHKSTSSAFPGYTIIGILVSYAIFYV